MSSLISCPGCGHATTDVLVVVSLDGGLGAARKRKCAKCEHLFTTLEERFEFSLRLFSNGTDKYRNLPTEPIRAILVERLKSPMVSKKRLARELGIGWSTLHDITTGFRPTMRRETAQRVAERLGMHPAMIWGNDW